MGGYACGSVHLAYQFPFGRPYRNLSTICLPQIVAASCGGMLLKAVGGSQVSMFLIAGVLMLCGALAVGLIKDRTAGTGK